MNADRGSRTPDDAAAFERAHATSDDRAPSAAELAEDAYLDAQQAGLRAQRDDAARALGNYVPTAFDRADAMAVGFALGGRGTEVVVIGELRYRLDGVGTQHRAVAAARLGDRWTVLEHQGALFAEATPERRRTVLEPPY